MMGGMIESWGRGIERIMGACASSAVPAPLLQYEHSGLWITFPFAVALSGQDATSESPGKTTQKTSQRILQLLRERPEVSRREIAEILVDITESGIKYQLNRMKKDGLIERIGPAKGGHWKVREDKK